MVSPEPDVSLVEIDVSLHRCLILGSDGLWNMISAQEAVHSVFVAEKNNEQLLQPSPEGSCATSAETTNWINPSKKLVDTALEKWALHGLRADNTTVITVVIDPPGPPKAHVSMSLIMLCLTGLTPFSMLSKSLLIKYSMARLGIHFCFKYEAMLLD